jgi:hypothetical protein
MLLEPLQNIPAPDKPSPADLEGRKPAGLEKFIHPSPAKPEPNPNFVNREQFLLLRYLGLQLHPSAPLFAEYRLKSKRVREMLSAKAVKN